MEKFFRVEAGTKVDIEYKRWRCEDEKIRKVINDFFTAKGIESEYYRYSVKGMIGDPLVKGEEKNVRLSIAPTQLDLSRFGEQLKKPDDEGLCSFRCNSKMLKEFAKVAVENQLCYLWQPRIVGRVNGIYSCEYHKSSCYSFLHQDVIYGTVRSEVIKGPRYEGITEISGSEFYKILEAIEAEENGGTENGTN